MEFFENSFFFWVYFLQIIIVIHLITFKKIDESENQKNCNSRNDKHVLMLLLLL